jgi:GDP-L-fucose synthase
MRVLVTGASGMVGHAFRKNIILPENCDFIFVGSKNCDLANRGATFKLFKETSPDYVIHLAARVGGIKSNMDFVGEFYTQNILMNTNVIDASHTLGVKKVISLLSTCIYPDLATYPLTEDQIHNGAPHKSNFGYAYAKRMLDIHSRAYRQQYGSNFITAVPNNLFGENDNFDLENSHVIPAMIRKMWEAKLNNKDVVLWGDGSPLREFTYSKDLTEILLFLMEHYDDHHPINVGNTHEISIKEVAETIADILEFKGEIIWDTTKPKGQFRKPSDNSKLMGLGWREENYTPLKEALTNMCKWFIINYPNVRGIR